MEELWQTLGSTRPLETLNTNRSRARFSDGDGGGGIRSSPENTAHV